MKHLAHAHAGLAHAGPHGDRLALHRDRAAASQLVLRPLLVLPRFARALLPALLLVQLPALLGARLGSTQLASARQTH